MPTAQRGDIWQVDFGLAAKVRPALVCRVPFWEHERALYAVIPHTTALRGTRFEVALRVRGLEYGAFDVLLRVDPQPQAERLANSFQHGGVELSALPLELNPLHRLYASADRGHLHHRRRIKPMLWCDPSYDVASNE